jgi:hypothetical protein
MRPVASNTKRNVRQIFRSRLSATVPEVLDLIKKRDYEWPYKGVYEKHVVQLFEDLGLHKLETDTFPFTAWALNPPTPQERGVKFLKWAEDNKRSGGYGCCDSHHDSAEGFNEATDDLVERLKSEFPEFFIAAAAG